MLRNIQILVGLALVGLAALLYWQLSGIHAEEKQFDSAIWAEGREAAQLNDPGCVRGGMALDLFNSKALIGLPINQVLSMLGEPDRLRPDSLVFALGQCGWDWKHSELVVELNAQSHAVRAYIRTVN